MKKLIFLILLTAAAFSCKNTSIEFDNFEKQTIYFPIQYPIRTISLGNDLVDNSLEKEHKFHIGVSVGGFYNNNDRDWNVDFEVDPLLVPDNHLMRDAGTLKILPSDYYSLNPSKNVTIPKGSFNGLIEVQLTDDFFEDSLAITGRYVIPLRITGPGNNILHGQPVANASDAPDINDASQWEVLPKDYTLFGVKYVNPYHGKWLRRGRLTVRNPMGEIVDTKIYHAQYLEQNEVVSLSTVSLKAVTSSMSIDIETFYLRFDVNDRGEIVVSSVINSPITVIYGTGLYKENGDYWGGTPEKPTPRDVIYLDYFYKRTSGANTFDCEVSDTLVFRDRGIVYEDVRPTIVTSR
ncbi:MAG: DUF1735 domain-containing protein [Dysgonamonadaceae bacterium]|nr:DUF1735 domain-containing protein [Dysgonamonadaceae bacterium]